MIEADQTTTRHVFFAGSESAIRFVGSIPGHFGIGGIYEVSVYLAQGDNAVNRIEMSWLCFAQPQRHPSQRFRSSASSSSTTSPKLNSLILDIVDKISPHNGTTSGRVRNICLNYRELRPPFPTKRTIWTDPRDVSN